MAPANKWRGATATATAATAAAAAAAAAATACRLLGGDSATLWANALVLLVAEASRGLFVASLFTYILALSGGASSGDAQRLNAAAVSAYSVGRLLAAQLWGLAADRYSFRAVLTAALLVACAGHVLYVAAEAGGGAPGGGVYIVLASRALVGFGSGVLGVTRAVVCVLTPPEGRTGWFSLLSAAKFCGYAVMPVFCIVMGDPPPDASRRVHGGPHWDSFTMPAYALLAANALVLPPLWLLFDPALNGRSAPPDSARLAEPRGGALEITPLVGAAAGGGRGGRGGRGDGGDGGGGGRGGGDRGDGGSDSDVDHDDGDGDGDAQAKRLWGRGAAPREPPGSLLASAGGGGGTGRSPLLAGGAASAAPAHQPGDSLPPLQLPPPQQAPPPPARVGGGDGGGVNLLADPLLWSGVLLFTLLNGVSKGVLTLMEAIATPLFERLEGKIDSDASTSDVAIWFALLGSAGFLVYLFMSLPRSRVWWLPGDLTLLVGSSVATAVGALVLAHPWPGDHTLASLSAGAVLVWSVGAPIADVVATSCFSLVVAGKAQGRYMGFITMAGSVGRIVLPLVTVATSTEAALLLSTALTAAGVPAVLAYRAYKAGREAARHDAADAPSV